MQPIIATLKGASHAKGARRFILEMQADASVTLVRDPDNQFDRNAIKVMVDVTTIAPFVWSACRAEGMKAGTDNLAMLGFVDKETAARLAPLMDERPPSVTYPAILRTNGHTLLVL